MLVWKQKTMFHSYQIWVVLSAYNINTPVVQDYRSIIILIVTFSSLVCGVPSLLRQSRAYRL